ncbi:MAG: diguanylate cyclase [Burkholderiaceae bacterium]
MKPTALPCPTLIDTRQALLGAGFHLLQSLQPTYWLSPLLRLMWLTIMLAMLSLVHRPGLAQELPAPGSLSYMVQTDGNLSLKEAVAMRDKWQSADGVRASAQFSTQPVWFSWSLPKANADSGMRMLQLDTGSARLVTAWLINGNGQVLRRFDIGASQPYQQRRIDHNAIVIPVLGGKSQSVIARIESVEPVQFSPQLWTADNFRNAASRTLSSHAIVFGIGIAMMLFGLMMFFSLREKAYIAFLGWIPPLLLLQIFESGLAFQWFWPDKPHWNNAAAVLMPATFAVSSCILTMTALEIGSNPPQWLRVVFQVSGAVAVALMATVTLIPWSLAIQMAWAVTAFVLISSIVASVIRLRQGARAAGGYLVGIVASVIAVPGHWMVELGWVDQLVNNNMLLLGAGSFSIIAISVGLALRLYSEDSLRQHAQSNLMKSHKAATSRLEENVRARTFELEIANERLARVNRIDGLTGVFNRRHFDETFSAAMLHASSRQQVLAVMMIDLDYFKRLNDTYGHAAGDTCLIQAAKLAESCIPETDGLIARYGGEEFVGLLTSTTPEQAIKVAEQIRQKIESAHIEHDGKSIEMTASLGLQCAIPAAKSDPATFLACADEALYRAKEGGRNQVVICGDDDDAAHPDSPTSATAPLAAEHR